MSKGTPIRCSAVESSDKVRRKVFCRNYSDCLETAIKRKWPGFSCEECISYDQEKLEGDQLHEDLARCMALAFYSGAVDLTVPAKT